jgi:exodeoxyribonuclease VII large subunit
MREIDADILDEKVYTVTEITANLKGLIERRFPRIWIVGEVSNCSVHSSGHVYFTLKDETAQMRCVLFSRTARRVSILPQDGLKIYARGRLTVYERQGQYELIVDDVLPMGKGELYVAFSKLKERLDKEGLFDPARKKALPRFPSRIALVTSPTGAAVRDVIRVSTKIHAGVEVVVYPVKVQGEGAKEQISEAIGFLNAQGGFDVIVLARGGGSIEDLWAFNEEIVARAIDASEIPVVSAVGHEIDFTIADFVADARAPTPSSAPTLVLADYVDARTRLESLVQRADAAMTGRMERYATFLENLRTRYGLRAIWDRLLSKMRDLDESLARGERLLSARIESERGRLAGLFGKLEALSPQGTLERGYSICFREVTGEVVRDSKQVATGEHLRVKFFRGAAISRVESTEEGE